MKKLSHQKYAANLRRTYRKLLLFFLTTAFIVACNQTYSPKTASEKDCRPVEHAVGQACVPLSPERLVTLSVPTLADAIAVGIKPVGTTLYFDQPPPYLEKSLEGIESVGKDEQSNLEKILTLRPDLIIGFQYSDESVYTQLAQIAPTVLDNWKGYPSWKDHFNFVAEVLGKTDEAQDVWSHYEQRIKELRTALGNDYQDIEVSFVHICCGTIDIDLRNSFSGTILEDVGLRRPPAQDVVSEDGLILLSEERLMDIDGDVIFIAATTGESQKLLEQLKQNPLWNQLKAVQQGRVYPVNYPTWRGGNPLAASAVIDDLFQYLVPKESTSS